MFYIFETLFILAIDDGDGDILESVVSTLEPALASAVLAELVWVNRIRLEDGRIFVMDSAPTDNPILDRALLSIVSSGRTRKLKYWINTLIYEKLAAEIGHTLVEKGVLVRKKKRLLLVTPFGADPAGQVSAKYGIKNHLREIVLAGHTADPRDVVQLGLLSHCDLLPLVFTRGERKGAVKKIKVLVSDNEMGLAMSAPFKELICVETGLLD